MSESVVSFFGVIAYLGSWQLIVPGGVFLLAGMYAQDLVLQAKTLFYTLVASELFVLIVKILMNKPRPGNALVTPEDPWSFPSAHSSVVFVLYGLLAFFVWQRPDVALGWKIATLVVAVVIATLVCASRVVLHVHDLTDVIGGAVIGIVFLVLGIWYFFSFS